MTTSSFEWDENKNKLNQKRHNISFEEAQYAFQDINRVIAKDFEHSKDDERFFCFGKVVDDIITVRFPYRNNPLCKLNNKPLKRFRYSVLSN